MTPTIYVDLRALQDPHGHSLAVQSHLVSLLRQRPDSDCAAWKLIGLVDDAVAPLLPQYALLADEINRAWNSPLPLWGGVFIDGAPMNHDPALTVRFTSNRNVVSAAVVHDFIPLDWPGYLQGVADRIEYLSRIVRLSTFDLYFPVSEYSARRLIDSAGPPPEKITVTGSPVRRSLFDIRHRLPANRSWDRFAEPYFVTSGFAERHKNTAAAVIAVREVSLRGGRAIPLRVIGNFDEACKKDWLQIARHREGAGFLEFWTDIDDDTLVRLYAGATATICPSHIEGFDVSMMESLACGTPVIASRCGAHAEHLGIDSLFPSDDTGSLAEKIERVCREPGWRVHMQTEQCGIAAAFHEREVGRRFWNTIARYMAERNSVTVSRKRKPKVAILTPYPPDQSGVANFSELTIAASDPYFSVDLYTDAARPLDRGPFQDAGRIGAAALLKGPYDSILSVIGNSHFHTPVFEFCEKFGGPCILHDSRLTHIYYHRLGHEGFRSYASSILDRPVQDEEIVTWLRDGDHPSLFIERIARVAKPLIVHTRRYQMLLHERFGIRSELATFCPNMQFSDEELSDASRAAARQRMQVPTGVFLVSTFGFVGAEKGMDRTIMATELLRSWRIPVELHFVGDPLGLSAEIQRLALEHHVESHVHVAQGFVHKSRYRDYMLAADAAVQLRNYDLGQPSAALVDCISAGLPSVAPTPLADSCDAPDYVTRLSDPRSPVQIAEGLAAIWEAGRCWRGDRESRQHYLSRHSFDYYVKRLSEILELA